MRTKKVRISTQARTAGNGNLRITTSVSDGSRTITKSKTFRLK